MKSPNKVRILSVLAAFMLANPAIAEDKLYFGADLSFATRMQDCKGHYYDSDGREKDVYTIFKEHGANLIRLRIWNEGNRTGYSDLHDVERQMRRIKGLGMETQLSFQYSDTWADALRQVIPEAWKGIRHTPTDGRDFAKRTRAQELAYDRALADTLYQYTYYVLTTLDGQGLMPEMVQVGNEINPEMLGDLTWQVVDFPQRERPIDWERDAMFINAGIKAVRDAGAHSKIKPIVMLQIAWPQRVEPWFEAATKAGITDYDMIGMSYYAHRGTTDGIPEVGATIQRLRKKYPNKQVMVIETGYPWTSDYDMASRVNPSLDDILPEYPASTDGQKRYLFDLTHTILAAGGNGLNYWAPDQVTNQCNGRANGRAYALFDLEGRVLPGINFMKVRLPK